MCGPSRVSVAHSIAPRGLSQPPRPLAGLRPPCPVCGPPPSLARLGKLGRSESLRVCERKRSQRGSAKGKQPRSRSDVDIQAAARANELEDKLTLDQARHKQGSRK